MSPMLHFRLKDLLLRLLIWLIKQLVDEFVDPDILADDQPQPPPPPG